MSDAQLLSCFNRLEKILNETKIYTKLMNINKDGLAPNYYDEDELLFPLEIGHEMYNKTLKVYLESKAYIEGIEKSLNKCIDKIGKNEKGSHLINQNKFSSNSSSNSSSSSDEESSKQEIGQKRKSKKVPPNSKLNKRLKQPDTKEDIPSNATTTTTTTTSTTTKDHKIEKDKSDKEGKADKSDKENGSHTPSKEKGSQSTTPLKDNNGNGNSANGQIQPGQLVAARDTKLQWILAKVNSYSPKTQKYEVIDEDEDEPKRFSVGSKDILQLPSPNNLPQIPLQTKVLAMFPDTTAFYPAVVVNVHKVKGKPTHYHLHFEDDQENGETPNRRVNAQHVIQLTK
ncbi:hypothetical protein DICPUDRAFT_54579 [Dictyostelium purpureum]|uniref:SGF29 C-terminal domain-containing protein n=1 Tax=Dictyostelium purpureum TaxID=5786 RepID=F0ZHT4_DICPU|nr:uncharacterized protein DICPUDRAFT_54579 [Dictyostelium purpureum]EGC36465.1 hypothetical protein DICPUDRAFT_54579 [Dictyostelium purpureum]|eukprot:XP_003286978.1 hypothetical protein DICPUDRAFT_54579 [Dictyostelium purpureum]